MNDDLELMPDGSVKDTNKGAYTRRGRPDGFSQKAAQQMDSGELDIDDPTVPEPNKLARRKAIAIVEKEEALAKQAWLKFNIDSGEYLPREAFREATATLLAELAQGLRSLPDEVERKYSLPPEVIELLTEAIDTGLNKVAESLEMFTEAPQ